MNEMRVNRIGILIALYCCAALAGVASAAPAAPAAAPALPEPVRQRLLMDSGWKFTTVTVTNAQNPVFDDSAWRKVDLPHDWSIEGTPDPKNPSGGAGGFYPTGIGWYRRVFDAPKAWDGKRLTIEFEGVYMNTDVWINGTHLGFHPYGYTSFYYDLTPHIKFGEKNLVAVRVDNSKQPNSRWYSGSGIYRHVWLHVTGPVHVGMWGIHVTTPQVTTETAKVVIQTTLMNDAKVGKKVRLWTEMAGPGWEKAGEASTTVELSAGGSKELTQEIKIDKPMLWSPQLPYLYYTMTHVYDDQTTADEMGYTCGIRSLKWSADQGLLLNGKSIKLNGGCLHHDNGCLGAAAFDRAEVRRVELLKSAGFNAVRTAHNPPSPTFLDACDRYGILVMDEAFDCWEKDKNKYDYSTVFKEWWQRDLRSMVLRDRNHPSVAIWSIGNEVVERGEPSGARIGRTLADFVRSLDSTRPVTSAVCDLFGKNKGKWEDTDGLFSALDIAGYNYTLNHAQEDHQRVPGRVMVATESFPSAAFDYWAKVHEHPWIIGDFVWTAMDYLGESGIGRVIEAGSKEEGHGSNSLFPWHGAACGDLNICGFRKPQSYYREILWNPTSRIYLFVRVPAPEGKTLKATPWGMLPAIPCWSWPGREGKPMEVEVYSDCDEIKLFVNDKPVGQAPTTRAHQFKALLSVPYTSGTLKAIGYKGGKEVTNTYLKTAGEAANIRLAPDHEGFLANGQDFSFVAVILTDKNDDVVFNSNKKIRFSVEGPAVIAGVANGDLTTLMPYRGDEFPIYQGRAMVVLRSTHEGGRVMLKASAEGLPDAVRPMKTVMPKNLAVVP